MKAILRQLLPYEIFYKFFIYNFFVTRFIYKLKAETRYLRFL